MDTSERFDRLYARVHDPFLRFSGRAAFVIELQRSNRFLDSMHDTLHGVPLLLAQAAPTTTTTTTTATSSASSSGLANPKPPPKADDLNAFVNLEGLENKLPLCGRAAI